MSRIDHTTGFGLNTYDTGTIDSSGAELLVAIVSAFATSSPTLTDSKGNTWVTNLTQYTDDTNNCNVRAFYCINPGSVGSGHKLTIGGSVIASSCCFAAFDDVVAGLDTGGDVGHNGTSAATSQQLSVTPTVAGCFVVLGAVSNLNTGTFACDDGDFTKSDEVDYSGGVPNEASAMFWGVKSASGNFTPTLSWTDSSRHAECAVVFAPPATDPTLTATDLTANRIFQRTKNTTSKAVTFSGSYADGDTEILASVEIKVVAAVGGATVVDWTALSSPTIGGGTWSGTITVPQGGGYHWQARSKDGGGTVLVTTSESSNYWAVGKIHLFAGQSNMLNMTSSSSSPNTPNTNVRQYTTAGGYAAVAGNGCIDYANHQNTADGIPLLIVQTAVSGSGLHAGVDNDYWMHAGAGTPYTLSAAALTAVGGDCEKILWQQGETDAFIGVSKSDYKTDLATLYGQYRTATGRSTSELKFGVAMLGSIDDGTATDTTTNDIRQAQLEFAQDTTGAFYLGSCVDMLRSDNYHWSPASQYGIMGKRYSQAVLKQDGISAYGSDGAKISSANWPVGSTLVTIHVTHQSGGTTLKDGSGSASGSGLELFILTPGDGGQTASNWRLSSGTILADMSGARGASDSDPTLTYAYGLATGISDDGNINDGVYDGASGLVGDQGLPLQPTLGSVSAGALVPGSLFYHHLIAGSA